MRSIPTKLWEEARSSIEREIANGAITREEFMRGCDSFTAAVTAMAREVYEMNRRDSDDGDPIDSFDTTGRL